MKLPSSTRSWRCNCAPSRASGCGPRSRCGFTPTGTTEATISSSRGAPRAGARARCRSYDFEADFDLDRGDVVVWGIRDNAEKRALLVELKRLAGPGGSLIPRRYTLAQWRQHVCQVVAEFGLTKAALGATPHGLRHEYLCARAELLSGLPRALRRTAPLTRREIIRDRVARQIVAIDAGHHDTYTTETYYGPRTEKAPQGLIGRIARCLTGPVREPLIRRMPEGRFVGGKGRQHPRH